MSDQAPPAAEAPKKKKRKRGKGGNEAEKLVMSWLELAGWLVHRAARAGFIKTAESAFCRSHDMFGVLDLIAIQRESIPETWALQVTTHNGLTERRRKLESIKHWPVSWRVSLASHETTQDPANRTRRLHFVRIEDYDGARWLPAQAIQFDYDEVESYRKAAEAKRKADAPPRKPKKKKAKDDASGGRGGGSTPGV